MAPLNNKRTYWSLKSRQRDIANASLRTAVSHEKPDAKDFYIYVTVQLGLRSVNNFAMKSEFTLGAIRTQVMTS